MVASDDALAARSIAILDGVLQREHTPLVALRAAYRFQLVLADAVAALQMVAAGSLDALLVAARQPGGRIDFTFHTGENIAADRTQLVSIGTLAVGILDWTASPEISSTTPASRCPTFETTDACSPGRGGAGIVEPRGAEFASRRIVGIVFVVLIFITLVIYGMWVAAGVVAEKASRVMELMISAASPRQLVVGKVAGIGAAGLTQAVAIVGPALLAIAIEDPLATRLLGPGPSVAPSLAGVSPAFVAAFFAYFILGFVLYALIYAAAGSLVSRAEDLQMLALPLSLIAIVGYLQAVLALTGGSAGFIRFASYFPFWSPFVMLTRLAVGRVEPWEIVLSFGLLVAAIAVVFTVSVRVYAAGVLLYGQRPGVRAIVGAVLRSQ